MPTGTEWPGAELTEAEEDETAPATERWEPRIGAPVFAADGALGTVRQIVIQPGEERVRGLIVRTGLLPPHDLLIPLEAVEEAEDDQLWLNWPADEARGGE